MYIYMLAFTAIAYAQLAIYSVLGSYLPAYLLTHWNYVPLMLMYVYVTRHEKIGLMCTKYMPLHYSTYLTFYVTYTSFVNCIKFPIVCCSSCKSFIVEVHLDTKL